MQSTYAAVARGAAIAVVVVFAPAALAGDAATIASLSSQLDAAHLEKANALSAMSAAEEDAAPKVKEIKLWNEQLAGYKPQVDAMVQQRNRHNADADAVNAKVAQHNANCAGKLPRPQYERCKGEEPYLQSEINRINNQKARLEGESKALLKRITDIENRRDSLLASLKQIESRYQSAKARLENAQQRIASITARLRTECASPNTPEGLSYCGQVDWDGARRGLTAPNLQPRPFTATPN